MMMLTSLHALHAYLLYYTMLTLIFLMAGKNWYFSGGRISGGTKLLKQMPNHGYVRNASVSVEDSLGGGWP